MVAAALSAYACHFDDQATFDDQRATPGMSGAGSGATSAGGSASTSGGNETGGESDGGSDTAGTGGRSTGAAGTGGSSPGGGQAAIGGKTSTGGAAGAGQAGGGAAGKGGSGNGAAGSSAGTGAAGMAAAGTSGMPDPPPVVYETRDIDDTYVESCAPSSTHGAEPMLNVDGGALCDQQTLITIPLDAIPSGARVSAASLTLTCMGMSGTIIVSYVDEKWGELNVRWNNRPNAGTTIAQVACGGGAGRNDLSIDLTSAVKAWLAGEHENFGIYLRTDSSDGAEIDSSEAAMMNRRPQLSVTYIPVK